MVGYTTIPDEEIEFQRVILPIAYFKYISLKYTVSSHQLQDELIKVEDRFNLLPGFNITKLEQDSANIGVVIDKKTLPSHCNSFQTQVVIQKALETLSNIKNAAANTEAPLSPADEQYMAESIEKALLNCLKKPVTLYSNNNSLKTLQAIALITTACSYFLLIFPFFPPIAVPVVGAIFIVSVTVLLLTVAIQTINKIVDSVSASRQPKIARENLVKVIKGIDARLSELSYDEVDRPTTISAAPVNDATRSTIGPQLFGNTKLPQAEPGFDDLKQTPPPSPAPSASRI